MTEATLIALEWVMYVALFWLILFRPKSPNHTEDTLRAELVEAREQANKYKSLSKYYENLVNSFSPAILDRPVSLKSSDAKAAYRQLVKIAHPDQGGSREAMQALTKLYEAAQ